jgi:hypothetical protein
MPYSDPCSEKGQHPLPTVCKWCGKEGSTCWFKNNPGMCFECGTVWFPVSAYAKRPEPEWVRNLEFCKP